MAKAYDRTEWRYLQQILLKLGFSSLWVDTIMKVVTSVQYYFLHGGEEFGPVIPQRGLRQGDPLSPYQFIICDEGLSARLSALQNRGRIHGAQVARRAVSISHLFFLPMMFFILQKQIQQKQMS